MNRQIGAFTLFVSFIGISSCCYYFYKIWRTKRPPTYWQKLGRVKNLYVYPLKSGRYVDVNKVECEKFGFSLPARDGIYQLRDRAFMVYGERDMEGKWMGVYNSIILIAISSIGQNSVLLEAPGKEALKIQVPIKNKNNLKTIKFQNWNRENVPIIDCGEEASRWLSQFLLRKDSGLRLGFHDTSFRQSKYCEKGLYNNLGALLLLNEKSLTDLNEKLEKKVSSIHFRPNIVIDGPDLEPFAEHNCVWIKIGDVISRNFFDCVRCSGITVDPETGIRDKTRESLKTLSKYRMSNGPMKGPVMGVYLEVVVPGIISVDDEVLVGIED